MGWDEVEIDFCLSLRVGPWWRDLVSGANVDGCGAPEPLKPIVAQGPDGHYQGCNGAIIPKASRLSTSPPGGSEGLGLQSELNSDSRSRVSPSQKAEDCSACTIHEPLKGSTSTSELVRISPFFVQR
jgi:hypothetical protein